MRHSAKYLIHTEIRTDGVVERSDVVGAVFGQTEGLLGEELDLRTLQDSEKVGRIDVDIESTGGNSVGTFTVASSMDRVETAVLAASFETIDRVGPCRASCTVTEIEDVRAAKRREVVDRATQLLQAFEETAITGDRLIEEVRERVRAAEITEHAGLPAGPHVETSDAIIVVEGRADVRQLLAADIRNAIAVEGTDIPDAVVRLTDGRTTTAFLDGDRGGDLILEELAQVGHVDYVAFAPDGQSVEDLGREAVTSALRRKIPYEQVTEGTTPREAFAPTEGGTVASGDPSADAVTDGARPAVPSDETAAGDTETGGADASPVRRRDDTTADLSETASTGGDGAAADDGPDPQTLAGHVDAVVGDDTGTVRLLDGDLSVLASAGAEEAFDTIADSDTPPRTVVLDGTVTQRILDIAAQRGVGQVVGRDTGDFVKQPTSVRVRVAGELLQSGPS